MKRFLSILILLIFGFFGDAYAQISKADSLMKLGLEAYRSGNYEESGKAYLGAADAYLQEADTANWLVAKSEYGVLLVNSGDARSGLEILLSVQENYSSKLDERQRTIQYNRIGYTYRKLENNELAKKNYEKALELARAANDSANAAHFENNLSYIYQEAGDYETAFRLQKSAKEVFEAKNYKSSLSKVLNGMFLNMTRLGLYEQAAKYIRQSLALREELGEPAQLDIAYHNMASSMEYRGKKDSAIVYYQKSLELTRKLGKPKEISLTLLKIGDLFVDSGEFEKALSYYNEALNYYRELDLPISITESLIRIAKLAVKRDDFQNAISIYNEALEWLDRAEEPLSRCMINLDLASVETELGNYQTALKYLDNARQIVLEIGLKEYEATTYRVLGEIYYGMGDLPESLTAYRKAYNLSLDKTVASLIFASKNLARAYREVSSDSAFVFADEAFSLIDSMRTNVAGLTFRAGFFRDHASFYNEVAKWYVHENNPQKAFELIEAAKARVLMDELAVAKQQSYTTLSENEQIRKQQLTKQIDRLYQQIEDAETDEEKAELRNQLTDLEFGYNSFLNELQVRSAELKNFKYPDPMSVQQTMNLLDENSGIIEFAVSDENLLRFVITESDISAAVVEADSLADAIKDFREAVINKAALSELYDKGEHLYEFLFSNELQKHEFENILIIPDGPLTFLPFEVLSSNNRYLIELYTIKYLPSVSIFPYINNPHREAEFELFAVAGSGFDGVSTSDQTVQTRSQGKYSSLPSTLLEIDSIADHFNKTMLLKNEEVTEAAVKSVDLSTFRFLHFATHAEVDEKAASQSGLVLSGRTNVETSFGEDGFLNSREISGMQLNADLVVLSACNTGMGKLVTGEGLLGLQRSFISAGASSVVVSLWSVFDRSTSVFMSEFYQNMLQQEQMEYGLFNKTLNWFGWYTPPLFDFKAKALRETKLSMIDHPYYNHPVYWAAFILNGK